MGYLIISCGAFNTLKPILNWKFCNEVIKNSLTKAKYSNKWNHFTKRKIITNANKPLSGCIKICIGLATGIGLKLSKDNTVFCLFKNKENLDEVIKEPEFNWEKFWKLLQPYWPELLGAILAAIVCALLNIQIPIALGNIIDLITRMPGKSKGFFEEMKKPTLILISYYALQSLFTFFYIALLANVGEGISKTMKLQLFSSIMEQDVAYFDQNRSGEILNRLTVDVQDFKSSFKMTVSQGLRNITQIIGSSISLALISPHMAGALIISVPAVVLAGTLVGSLLRQLSHDAKSQSVKVNLAAGEAIENIRTVRSLAMEEFEKNLVGDEAEACRKLNVKLGFGIALFQAGTNLFLNTLVLSTIYCGGYLMSLGNISAGELMAFLAAMQVLQRSFTNLSLLFGVYIKGKHAGARVFEIIDLPQGKSLKGDKIIPSHSLIPNVQFRDVVFSYPTRPDKKVLKKVSFDIPEGKTVAIIGASGSGKSTLAWLLERFYDVDGGSVLVGGENVRDLNPTWLRKHVIGFISQEPVLFATTIMENIRFGKPSATDEEVIEAAKLTDAHNFIKSFPQGYQTKVGERGTAVSGGQKQRIALARALLKKPDIIILDEATSALDAESEKAVLKALEKLTGSRTNIVIAHRLSTIKNADLIVVLDNGTIVESGTHTELLAKNGKYAALVKQQVETS